MHIAQMNVGTTLYDLDDKRMAGFVDNLDRINALADTTPGFVWRLQSETGNATDIKPADDLHFIVNMSVWETVEALFDYVYRSDHRSIMVGRRAWFKKPEGPYQVLWWVEEGARPTVEDGLARLDHLARHGPSPYAFTFKRLFPAGAPDSVSGPLDLKPDPYWVGWA